MSAILRATKKSEKYSQKHRDECAMYFAFTAATCAGALIFTDLKFSSLMTLGAAFQCLGFGLLLLQVSRGRGLTSISACSLVLQVFVLTTRLYASCFYDSYIPVDRSGDFIYQTIEAASLAMVLVVLYKLWTTFRDEYDSDDKNGIDWVWVWLPVAMCGAAAVCLHPELNQHFYADTAWTFSIYLEAIAMVPQVFLLTKLGGSVECLQGHYMAATFVARLIYLRLWGKCYAEIAAMESGGRPAAYGILVAFILPVIVLADFMYLYLRNLRTGGGRAVVPIAI